MVLKLTYFASCDLRATYQNKSLLPVLKIMSVTGFHAEDFRISNGKHNPLSCYGELKIAYCITQSIPCLDSHRVGAWSETHSSRDWRRYYRILNNQQDSFNESIELPLPYSSLYDYNGICLVLCSTFTDTSGVHDQYLAGGYLSLYNSKRIFRNGIYELELRSLQSHNPRSLNEALEVIISEDFNAKPKELEEINRLLKINRKQMRGELFDTPIDRHTLPFVERTIEELKRKSGKIFLSLKFEFSRSYPHLYLPVIFERPWNPVDEMYFKMTRNVRTADMDRERKPNKDTLDKLKVFPPFFFDYYFWKAIISRPSGEILSELDGDLIWKFRFYLAKKFPESALPKFLLSVRWEYPEQVTQAIELLHQWPVIDPENILELLTKQFPHGVCRKFAVCRLQSATAEDLQLYLYQLVQALRYENISAILAVSPMTAETAAGHVDSCKTDDATVAPTDPATDTSSAATCTQETTMTKRTGDVPRGRPPHDIATSLSTVDLPWDDIEVDAAQDCFTIYKFADISQLRTPRGKVEDLVVCDGRAVICVNGGIFCLRPLVFEEARTLTICVTILEALLRLD
ncbi:unnamed protein product [Dibothriocephalus latus]|uniref:PIK helical domain-containing protein n=1 Tax=Dibothriocephalus latus TaxID=60516 RepID=A0A3P7NP49_DIBLA|nr:unnamed protein product [Dibothriocephalus latus]